MPFNKSGKQNFKDLYKNNNEGKGPSSRQGQQKRSGDRPFSDDKAGYKGRQSNRFGTGASGFGPRKSRAPQNAIPESRAYSPNSGDNGYETATRSNRQYDSFAKRASKPQFGDRHQSPQGRGGKPGFGKPSFERNSSPASQRFGPGSRTGQFGRPAQPRPAVERALPVQDQVMGQTDDLHRVEEDLPQVNLLTGRNPIREAIKTGRDLEKLMIAKGELSGSAKEIVSLAKKAGIMIQSVERTRLDQLAKNHQGMIAFASAYQYSQVEDILETAKQRGEAPFIIVLDQITDPHNLGAVIRTAACAGVHGVIVPMHRAVGLTPAAVKASAGAVEHIKVARVTNLNQTIKSLQKQGIWFYAAQMEGEDYRKVRFDGPCALVIGSEGEGVSQLTASICDKQVKIPMQGEMNSLNASVAAGILMYAVYGTRNPA